MIITLDGPAGSGKSTLAILLGQRLNLAYLDTGSMFRALALFLSDQDLKLREDQLETKLSNFCFDLSGYGNNSLLYLNGTPLGQEIRNEDLALKASNLGQIAIIRQKLKQEQQKLGRKNSLVAEGRDMGTVVFPGADYKFFLTASPEERAKRRLLQLKDSGLSGDLEKIAQQIKQRDQQDQNRSHAPLKPAEQAIILDSTYLNQDQVLEKILKYIKKDHLDQQDNL